MVIAGVVVEAISNPEASGKSSPSGGKVVVAYSPLSTFEEVSVVSSMSAPLPSAVTTDSCAGVVIVVEVISNPTVSG